MQKSREDKIVSNDDLIPLLFLCGLIMFIGVVLLGGFTVLDSIATDYCYTTANPLECMILTKESH